MKQQRPDVLNTEKTLFPTASEVLAQHVAFLDKLVQRGGPQDDEHRNMDAWIAGIYNGLIRNEARDEWLEALRKVLRPVLIPSTMHGWAYLKPHGYAGDFEIIDRHYQRYVTADPAFAAWDRYWQAGAAAKAVRNRKSYFHELLEHHVRKAGGAEIAVLNIASGPGRDVSEFLSKGSNNVRFDCIDQDSKAIEHAVALCQEHSHRVNFINANALRYHPTGCYDVIWSAGLFDYFSDRAFKLLLRRLIPKIAPGGQLVIGNFSDSNPNHDWLHFCDWHLQHRSSEQLVQLALEAGAQHEDVSIGKEPEGVNLFLHITQTTKTTSAP
jgi:extracellular factor (EF) 3-hydroxypalmitic acid methyl ester biosynthesis protein